MEIINQLEVVKQKLAGMSTAERTQLSLDTGTSMRTLYHMVEPGRKPAYDTVHRVFVELAKRKPARGKK